MSHRDAYLLDTAADLGVRVEYGRLRSDRDGVWLPDRRLIRLRPDMHARQHRSVLAHELAHAIYDDQPTRFGPVHSRQERRAEGWAALALITTEAYRQAETVCDGHAGAMAVELGVMRSTVDAYQHLLQRLGDLTYLHARMGAGQWAARVDVLE